jgi:hypothetical protein
LTSESAKCNKYMLAARYSYRRRTLGLVSLLALHNVPHTRHIRAHTLLYLGTPPLSAPSAYIYANSTTQPLCHEVVVPIITSQGTYILQINTLTHKGRNNPSFPQPPHIPNRHPLNQKPWANSHSITSETAFSHPAPAIFDFVTDPSNWGKTYKGSGGMHHKQARDLILPLKFGDE